MQIYTHAQMQRFLGTIWHGQWNARFAHATVIVIVKLVQWILNDPGLALLVEIGSVIFKGIKVLRHTLDQRLETRIRFGTRSVVIKCNR
jgi:hypothetical protein